MVFVSPPLLYFKGEFFTNVDTANNNDASPVNYVDCRSARMRLDAVAPGTSADQFREWCKSASLPAGWNPFGDNACWFKNVVITGSDIGAGLETNVAVEPLIGSKLQIGKATQRNTAIMVDVDPEGILGTQLYSDQIRIDKGLTTRLSGQPGKAYSYFLNFGRNLTVGGFSGASAVWQFEIPFGELALEATGSPFLEAINAMRLDHSGLVVRFATYLVAPSYSKEQLAVRFAAGHNDENPAKGVTLGSIGVASHSEIGIAPSGRPLFPTASFNTSHKPWALGAATATVDESRQKVVLDLLSTFPEEGQQAAKVDVGPAHLAYIGTDGSAVKIGEIPYDTKTFNQSAGLVDIDVPAGMLPNLLNRPLQIYLEKHGKAASEERPLRIETTTRGFYLEPGQSFSIPLKLTLYGRAPGVATAVQIAHYETTDGEFSMANPASPLFTHPMEIETDTDGIAQVTVRAEREGVGLIRFLQRGEDPFVAAKAANGIFPRLDFCSVRVLPTDDYSAIPDSSITWDFVYKEIFEYYYCLYPAMDRFFQMNHEPSIRAAGPQILARMHPDLANRWEYMPRTRELSSGKRALFERWLSLP